MKFTIFTPLDVEFWFTKAIDDLVGETNQKIQTLTQRQAEFLGQVDAFRNADLSGADLSQAAKFNPKMKFAALLQDELALRRELPDVLTKVHIARQEHEPSLDAELKQTTDDLCAKFQAMGYAKPPTPGTFTGCYGEQWLLSHPAVIGLRDRKKELSGLRDVGYQTGRDNEAAIKAILADLEAIRRSLTQV